MSPDFDESCPLSGKNSGRLREIECAQNRGKAQAFPADCTLLWRGGWNVAPENFLALAPQLAIVFYNCCHSFHTMGTRLVKIGRCGDQTLHDWWQPIAKP